MGDRIKSPAYDTDYGRLCRAAVAYVPNPTLKGLARHLGLSYASLRDRMSGRTKVKNEHFYALRGLIQSAVDGQLMSQEPRPKNLTRPIVLSLIRENIGIEHDFSVKTILDLIGGGVTKEAVHMHVSRLVDDGHVAHLGRDAYRLEQGPVRRRRGCRIPGCEGEHHALGLCPRHYMQVKKHNESD